MKSLLLTVVVVVFAHSSTLTDNKPYIGLYYDFGYVPKNVQFVYKTPFENRYDAIDNTFLMVVNGRLEWRILYGDITVSTFSNPTKGQTTFTPFRVVFSNDIGMFYDVNRFRFSAGWNHTCGHKVAVASFEGADRELIDRAFDKIYIRISYTNRR